MSEQKPERGARTFRARGPKLDAESARRQGEITNLALKALGAQQAIAFLNTAHDDLGGRPLDLATESQEGYDAVAGTLAGHTPQ